LLSFFRFFFKDVAAYFDENCKAYTSESETLFSGWTFLSVVFTWVCVFFCVFKGVKSSSYVVWVTVPLPILFIIIMVIRNAMLPGAGDGILMYIAGKGS
jgi:SNF family Na+-dependent transporter